ncbi:hypothetical protein C8F04DRAFT_1257362 [Mycena alexandri]|uniref:Uncharacterized protein n=1 Tax=Mycena alexandri TaxID=1745969 RepID=A0AAD6X9J7_9AGAR|nr:hypothetical protein C8F04DRAFT_1257362 [Mycena alexandri]
MESWSVFEIRDFYSDSLPAVVHSILRVAPFPPIGTLVIDGGFKNRDVRPFPEQEGEHFGPTTMGGLRRGLQWMLASDSPQAAVLVRTIEPDKDFKLPWSTLKCYAEAFTTRGGSRASAIPQAHLRRLTGITILCLVGVRLPDTEEVISLPLVEEFNYVLSWEYSREGRGRGGWEDESSSPDIHRALKKFLGLSTQLKILQIALHVPFYSDTLLEHLRLCENLEELDVAVCHPELWTTELFRGLQDLGVCPKLQVMRLPQLPANRDEWALYEGGDGDTRRDVGLDEMLGARFGAGLQTFDLRQRKSMRDDDWTEEKEQWADGPQQWAEAAGWDMLPVVYAGWVLPDDVWTRLFTQRVATGWDIVLDERRHLV